MTVFVRQGNSFIPTSERNLDVQRVLPVGNFIVKQNPDSGALYFEQVDAFVETSKIYGNTLSNVDRVLNTFQDREKSTGVFLNGEKGSGKTLLARMLSIEAAKRHDIPTIIINTDWRGDAFNKLIQDITQPKIVLFDEFEKVYDSDKQEEILTLFDGVFPSKTLFIVTCNDKYRVDANMRNRPGRMFYMLEFEGLDAEFITEYCNERLNDKSHIETICRISTLFSAFNFDILKAMVEEMNRYHETPHQVLKMLNAKPFSDDRTRFNITMTIDNIAIPTNDYHPTDWRGNPVQTQEIDFYYYEKKANLTISKKSEIPESEDEYVSHELTIRPTQLRNIHAEGAAYTYFLTDRIKVTFTKEKQSSVNYQDLGF